MKLRSIAPMRTAKIGYVALSSAMILLGVVFIACPGRSAAAMSRVLGIVTVLFGIVKLVGYFSKDLYRLAFQYDLEFGILLLAMGFVMILHPTLTMDLIAVAIGITTLFDGLFKSRIAIDAKRFGIGAWWTIMALGVMSDAAGVALILRPAESANVMAVLLGVSLIADGLLNLSVALETVKIVKRQYPDIIDPDYTETEDNYK